MANFKDTSANVILDGSTDTAIVRSVGTTIGAVIGSFGGPIGFAAGSMLGGAIWSFAGLFSD